MRILSPLLFACVLLWVSTHAERSFDLYSKLCSYPEPSQLYSQDTYTLPNADILAIEGSINFSYEVVEIKSNTYPSYAQAANFAFGSIGLFKSLEIDYLLSRYLKFNPIYPFHFFW